MFTCPNCHGDLVRQRFAAGVYFGCPPCGGRAVAVGVLRKTIGENAVAEIWSCALENPVSGGRSCPVCDRSMAGVELNVGDQPLTLDVCRRCEFVWFDRTEYEAIPPAPPSTKLRPLGEIDIRSLPLAQREALAMAKIEAMRAAEEPEPDAEWKTLPALLGLPVEMDSSAFPRTPWATYLLSALIVAVSVWAFFHLDPTVDRYGLIPAEAGREHGLTFLTSFFLHGGVWHLVGNIYFLLVFGRRVEVFIGRWWWLLLVFLAALAGDFLHVLGDPRDTLPCIGASGGISGLITFYALKFPHAKLGFLFRFYFYLRWIEFPAWGAFVLWVLLQVWGAHEQLAGYSNVSSLAHLGGVAVGVAFWLAWRDVRPDASNASTYLP